MNSCVLHRVIWGLLAFALCCIVHFGPCLLGCPGSSVGRALCLDCRVSWVRVPPRAANFFFEKSVVLGVVALHLCCLSPHYDSCILLSMEIRRLGGLITPACSYMLSYEFLCPTQSDLGFACFCIVLYSRLWALPAGLPLCLDCRVSLVRVPPRAAHFFFEKSVVLGVVELFALHLCCLSPHYDSCVQHYPHIRKQQ